MKRLLATLVALALTVFAHQAMAGDFAGLRTKLSAARESPVVMMLSKDRRGPDQQKLVKEIAVAVRAYLGR